MISKSSKARTKSNLTSMMWVELQDLERERELMTTKWFGYRFTPAFEATAQFEREYVKAYQDYYGSTFDRREARLKRATREGGAGKRGTELTSFWRARQFADSLCIPYRVFIRAAMEMAVLNGAAKLPRPNQLYGKHGESIGLEIARQWAGTNASRRWSRHAAFHNDAFVGLLPQFAHREWVIELIRDERGHPDLIAMACYGDCVLPEDLAVAAFGPERVDRARMISVGTTESDGTVGDELVPSCYGLPNARREIDPPCCTCSMSAACALEGSRLVDLVVAKRGTSDPVGDRKRKQVRERVARHRARKAVARTASVSVLTSLPA